MTKQEVYEENKELQTRISEERVKRSVLVQVMDELNTDYNTSKHLLPLQRYRFLKTLVKRAVNNKWI